MSGPSEARSEQATKDPALQTWHPVNLDLAKTKSQYITGMHALNLARLRQLSVNFVDFHFFPRPK